MNAGQASIPYIAQKFLPGQKSRQVLKHTLIMMSEDLWMNIMLKMYKLRKLIHIHRTISIHTHLQVYIQTLFVNV